MLVALVLANVPWFAMTRGLSGPCLFLLMLRYPSLVLGLLRSLPLPTQCRTLHEFRDSGFRILVNVNGNDQIGVLGEFSEVVPLNLRIDSLKVTNKMLAGLWGCGRNSRSQVCICQSVRVSDRQAVFKDFLKKKRGSTSMLST